MIIRFNRTEAMNSGLYGFPFVVGHSHSTSSTRLRFRADPGKKEAHLQRAEDVCRRADPAQLPDRAAINSGEVVPRPQYGKPPYPRRLTLRCS